MSDDVKLADLLAEYDEDQLRLWLHKQEEKEKVMEKERKPQAPRYLRKTNDKPIRSGDVVYDRKGKRYYIESVDYRLNKMTCVSMCSNKYRMSASCHEFGCYREGGSRHDDRGTQLSQAKQKLYDHWKHS